MNDSLIDAKILTLETPVGETFSSQTVDAQPVITGQNRETEKLLDEYDLALKNEDKANLKYRIGLGVLVALFYGGLFAFHKIIPVDLIVTSIASLFMVWVPNGREIRGDGSPELWDRFGYGSGFLSRFSGGATTRPYIMDTNTIRFFGWCGLIFSIGYGGYLFLV